MKKTISVGIGLLLLLGLIAFIALRKDDFNLPSGEPETTTIMINEEGKLQTAGKDNTPNKSNNSKTLEIMQTDGVRHSVPLEEIKGGGPTKDGIPSIDNPKFVSVTEASFLNDDEPGIAVSLNGVDRFYPFQILVWHEIVNDIYPSKDKKEQQRVLVTYCPLCLSGIVFDPEVKGEGVEFGTSGKLWQSNLVMYDRATDSLWSQIKGEAIVGEMTGEKLTVIPSDQMRFSKWRSLHPLGQVLSRDTGITRSYGGDPYGSYYTNNSQIISPVSNSDERLENKDFILGVVIDGKAKAYYPPAIKKKGQVKDSFAGKKLVVKYEKDIDAVRIYQETINGQLERLNPFPSFWFAWVAVHPDTELYK